MYAAGALLSVWKSIFVAAQDPAAGETKGRSVSIAILNVSGLCRGRLEIYTACNQLMARWLEPKILEELVYLVGTLRAYWSPM